jgi:hypothetical protein
MKKDNKKKKPCVPLDEYRAEQLARLIIGQTERSVRYGTDRKERIAAPGGAVILF